MMVDLGFLKVKPKIALMGTHGSGKTTTVEWLIEKLGEEGYEVDKVMDTARECPMPINQNSNRYSQSWIFLKQMIKEVEAHDRTGDLVVCDRSLLDSVIYSEVVLSGGIPKFMRNVWMDWVETYDCLFYLNRNEDYLEDDGLRDVDKDFWKEIDKEFRNFLRMSGLEENVFFVDSKDELIFDKTKEILVGSGDGSR